MKSIDARTMSMMLAGTFLASALAISQTPSAGGSNASPNLQASAATAVAPAQSAPAQPASLQALMRLIGDWSAEATLVIGGKTYRDLYRVDFRSTADGSGLYMDETFDDPQLGHLRGANLIGYNPFDSKIHWYSVDNMGTTHEHIGDWTTPDHFYMEHNSVQEDKPFVEKIDITLTGKDELVFKLVATLGGVETERGEGVFHRTTPMASGSH